MQLRGSGPKPDSAYKKELKEKEKQEKRSQKANKSRSSSERKDKKSASPKGSSSRSTQYAPVSPFAVADDKIEALNQPI